MNKNEIFKKFLENPLIKDKIEITEDQLLKMDLFTDCYEPLIDVIKTVILNMERDQTVSDAARKINQLFKNITV